MKKPEDVIVDTILSLIKFSKLSGFGRCSDFGIRQLAEALNGKVMDTYHTAALSIAGVLSLIPQEELKDIPDLIFKESKDNSKYQCRLCNTQWYEDEVIQETVGNPKHKVRFCPQCEVRCEEI